MTPISQTVIEHRIVGKPVISFTHTMEIEWMLPGIALTGKQVQVPFG